ncbi:hypothetical protein BH11ACT2_BH11ACT2_10220 [soil metagenome]
MGCMARTLLRTLSVLAVACAASAGLAACTADAPGITQPTASDSSTPSATATIEPSAPTPTAVTTSATPTPTPTTTAVASGTPVGINCDQLVTAQQMYDFNANFTLSDSYTPTSGTRAATVVGLKGIACEWINDSSKEKIDIAVANLGQSGMLAKQDQLGKGAKEVEVGGTSGYFATVGSVGRTDAFAVKYWITADSASFETADDASDLIADVIGNLPN